MTSSQMIIESNVDVTDNLTAPLCEFGDELCNLKVVKNSGEEQLLITLPTNGKAYDEGITSPPPSTVTYDMRSIIESIQELNRRTATFNCNVSFDAALKAYDVSPSPNANFACDTHPDGLPAATNGDGSVPALTEENKYRVLLCINHKPVENLHEDIGLVVDLTDTDKSSVDVSKDESIMKYISDYNEDNDDKIIYLEAYPNIHTYDESTRTVVIKVLTQSYFSDENRLWNYRYRIWRSEDFYERQACPAESERINYTKLSARYNYSLPSTEYIGGIYNAPMTSLVRTSDDDNPAKLPDSDVHVAECIYQFAPIEVSETPTKATDGEYYVYDITVNESNLKTIDLRYHDTRHVMHMTGMFHYNESVTDINIPEIFNTSRVVDFALMFTYTTSISHLILPDSFDTSKAVSLYKMFSKTPQLSTIMFNENFDTSSVKMMARLFYCCGVRGLLNLPPKFTAKSVKIIGMISTFAHMINCDSIVFPSNFEVGSEVTSYWEVFGYSGFRYLTIPPKFFPSAFTLVEKPDINSMFRENPLLTQLFLPDNFNLSQFSTSRCLANLSSLSLIYVGHTYNNNILTTTNNDTELLLSGAWSNLSGNLYTKNFKNFSINCDLNLQPGTTDFSNTLDIRNYPIHPGCKVTLYGYIAPDVSGELTTAEIQLTGNGEYSTGFVLSTYSGPANLPVTITFSNEYRSMKITSNEVSYGNVSWYLRWIYMIKIKYDKN